VTSLLLFKLIVILHIRRKSISGLIPTYWNSFKGTRSTAMPPLVARTEVAAQLWNYIYLHAEWISMPKKRTDFIRECQPGIFLLSIGFMALGALSVIYRDFAYSWQPVPAFHPGRDAVAIACGLFMIGTSVALLFRSTVAVAVRVIFLFLLAWLCLKIPAVIAMPQIEGVWLGFGEIAMLLAGGWVLFARFSGLGKVAFFSHITGAKGLRIAQIIFGLAVLPVGLSHIVYSKITTILIPSWLPFRMGLAYLTGFGQIACGLAILFSIKTRIAALIETGMLALFALLVWGPDSWIAATPKMAGAPSGARFPLTAFLITWVIGASALLVAEDAETVDPINSERESAQQNGEVAGTHRS
jgi:uncharacterized membrane protein